MMKKNLKYILLSLPLLFAACEHDPCPQYDGSGHSQSNCPGVPSSDSGNEVTDGQSENNGQSENSGSGSLEVPPQVVVGTAQDASVVKYFLQNIAQTAYQFDSQEELNIPQGTTLKEIDRTYPGFTASGFSQNGAILSVYYDRNIITIEYQLNGGTTSSSQLIYQGIFEDALGFPENPVKEGSDFIGWYDGDNRMPPAFPAEDGIYSAKWRERGDAPEGFVKVNGGTVVGSKDYAASDINTCQGVFVNKRTVTLSDFYMAKYEVTKKLYKEVMGDSSLNKLGLAVDPSLTTNNANYANNILPDEDPELLPVDGIYWNDAVYFCNLLSEKEGLDPVYTISNTKTTTAKVGDKTLTYLGTATVTIDLTKNGYRLPTEAEWEYAARGGNVDSAEFAWGYPTTYSESYTLNENHVLDSIAWYSYNSNAGAKAEYNKAGYASHQVGLKIPNSLGLFDMAGNVAEFVNDGEKANLNSAPTVATGTVENPLVQNGPNHFSRGGYWGSEGTFLEVSYRQYIPSAGSDGFTGNFRGFRLVRSKL